MTSSSSDSLRPTPRVAILLSVHNGEKFLEELLYSIEQQSYRFWDLWIRDDGSGDSSLALADSFRKRLRDGGSPNRVMIDSGNNLGVVGSFLDLAASAGDRYDAYAFCDQDDIWLPDKLERAVDHYIAYLDESRASATPKPWLYHSRQFLVGQDGKKRGMSPIPRHMGLENAIVQNQVVGCTMVIDSRLRHLLLESSKAVCRHDEAANSVSTAGPVIMHDWWCYLLASCHGVICYDETPTLLFRRHESSTTPVSTSQIGELWNRSAALGRRGYRLHHILEQADAFYRYFVRHDSYPLDPPSSRILQSFTRLRNAGFGDRLKFAVSSPHRRDSLPETWLLRFLVLINRL
ncbi:glycosyltransferase [Balneolales bacterium ANBcel1]|nr:glycosyltransferase [Balneolales bacterium ANBcel1]